MARVKLKACKKLETARMRIDMVRDAMTCSYHYHTPRRRLCESEKNRPDLGPDPPGESGMPLSIDEKKSAESDLVRDLDLDVIVDGEDFRAELEAADELIGNLRAENEHLLRQLRARRRAERVQVTSCVLAAYVPIMEKSRADRSTAEFIVWSLSVALSVADVLLARIDEAGGEEPYGNHLESE